MPVAYHLTLQSDPNEVHRVEALIKTISSDQDFSDDFLYDVMLIVTEATNNAILHGNKCNLTKKATLDCIIDGENLSITVTDEGEGFDPETIPDPLAEENLLKPSGRGVYLMKQFSKAISYSFTPNGTVLNLSIPIQRNHPKDNGK